MAARIARGGRLRICSLSFVINTFVSVEENRRVRDCILDLTADVTVDTEDTEDPEIEEDKDLAAGITARL
jgi:hypothetical protein